eukprot:scaffold89839_cov72-Phaeocystis_antarctica.AAC.2
MQTPPWPDLVASCSLPRFAPCTSHCVHHAAADCPLSPYLLEASRADDRAWSTCRWPCRTKSSVPSFLTCLPPQGQPAPRPTPTPSTSLARTQRTLTQILTEPHNHTTVGRRDGAEAQRPIPLLRRRQRARVRQVYRHLLRRLRGDLAGRRRVVAALL